MSGDDKNLKEEPLQLLSARHHHEEGGEGNWLVSYADMMTLLVGFFVILLSFSSTDSEKFEQVRKAITREFGGVYQIPFAKLSDRIKEALKKLGLGDQFIVKQNDLGVEISFLGTVFFNPGSANLKPEADLLLEKLIPIVKAEAGAFNILIEGHTDDNPLLPGSTFRNNWELSSIRACRVLDTFLGAGFPKNQLTAVGYADARAVVPNRDASGNPIPLNQSQNRRVVIKVLKHSDPLLESADSKGESGAPEEVKPTPDASSSGSNP